jgi:hypothetical protein
MSALGTFWPVFQGGQNLPSILLAMLLTIGFTVIVSYGVEATALLNLIGTLAKLVPLLIFSHRSCIGVSLADVCQQLLGRGLRSLLVPSWQLPIRSRTRSW